MPDLKILFPKHRRASVNGLSADVYSVKLRAMQGFAAIAGQLMTFMANTATPAGLHQFCADHAAEIEALLQEQTSLSTDQISELDASEAVMWSLCVVWANFDFFSQALPQVIAALPSGDESPSD